MDILKAAPDDYADIRRFYHSIIEANRDSGIYIGWKKDIYPSPGFIKDSIAAGELFVGRSDNGIAAAMVVNHQANDSYRLFEWPSRAADDEVTVVHVLGVHPMYCGRGYGRQMVGEVIKDAVKNRQKAIRLDVLEGNIPAERLYERMGFKYLHTLKMFYEDTGWTNYRLYEYAL